MADDTACGELPEDLRPHAASLSFDTTVSRRLVHRAFIDHVLVTDILRLDERRFLMWGKNTAVAQLLQRRRGTSRL